MGKYDEEIAKAIEGLRPKIKTPIYGYEITLQPAYGVKSVVGWDIKLGEIPPYIAFEHATDYVVITQARFNKLTKAQQSLLLAPAVGEQKPKRRRKAK